MLLVDATVLASPIHGRGLFANQTIEKGTIVFIWPYYNEEILDESALSTRVKSDSFVAESASRIVGKYFSYNSEPYLPEETINHSNNANVLCHCHIGMAIRKILPGEEITIDYGFLVMQKMPETYGSLVIQGKTAIESFVESAARFVSIIKEVEDWSG